MKRLLNSLIFSLAFLGIGYLCHKATDGFAMVNVYPPTADYKKWEREGEIPKNLLSQNFTYFASGSQSYVFLSEDKATVLKLFKFQHMRTPPILNFLPDFGKLDEKRAKKRSILEKTFDSFSLAYDLMKEETGLLYLHLNTTSHLSQKLTLIDKIGKKHTLDLDTAFFLFQKRGTLAYTAIDKWMKKGQQKQAEEGILTLLSLAAARCQKGIFDKDPDFRTNFGFIEDTPFQIDFGRYALDPEEQNQEIYANEMIRITRDFEDWIAKNYPSLLDSFKQALNEITTK